MEGDEVKENVFQGRMKKALEQFNATVLNIHGHSMQRPGIPDLYVAHVHGSCWIELKVGDNWLSQRQRVVCKELASRRDIVLVVRHEGHIIRVFNWKGAELWESKEERGLCVTLFTELKELRLTDRCCL